MLFKIGASRFQRKRCDCAARKAALAVPRATKDNHVSQIVALDARDALHEIVCAGLDRSRPVLPRHIAQALLFRPRAGPRAFGDAITPQSLSHGSGIGESMSIRRFIVPQRFSRAAGRRPCFARSLRLGSRGALLAAAMTLASAPAVAAKTCRPVLRIRDAQLSAYMPPVLERKWTATVVADASPCATTAGHFEIGFVRESEESPDLIFRERFTWSAPSVPIGLDFWFNEAAGDYWIYSIEPCPCAK
jgi:hypothetical protein